ncbi:hypothetical protein B0T19DRAFT_453142 [Cercophora scortea]|uniref:BTB domain-containing protein n=1 Tax=Cercophora scortea TaxID=314031 RepID=A0AAE0MLY1_9PEZI|nr:hypothetical protein B0T19DRAFT_453142 [Cercophora scortea]
MATNSSHQDSTTSSATNGDVIFVVGPSERRLRVHSTVIKPASKVFNALLCSNFSEGVSFEANSFVEVPLNEDDADAMETIFHVIHGRNDKIKRDLKPDEILEIAIAINNPETLVRLAVAAYLVGDATAFSATTSALLFRHAGSYLDLMRPLLKRFDQGEEFVRVEASLRTACMLAEERCKLRGELKTLAMEVATRDYFDNDAAAEDDDDCACGWRSKHCLVYMETWYSGGTASRGMMMMMMMIMMMTGVVVKSCS